MEKGVKSELQAVLQEDASFFVEKSKSSKIIQNISFTDNISAPIEKGEVLGEATYTLDNKVIKKVNIIANETVKKINLINMTTNLYENWFNLLR